MSTALLTDRYELTMVDAALRDGRANRRSVFELFARRLPTGRRFGVERIFHRGPFAKIRAVCELEPRAAD